MENGERNSRDTFTTMMDLQNLFFSIIAHFVQQCDTGNTLIVVYRGKEASK
jgi:hypothetical protein